MMNYIRLLLALPGLLVGIMIIPIALLITILSNIKKKLRKTRRRPKLLWGSAPIISLAYMANALSGKGYQSQSVVWEPSPIYALDKFNVTLIKPSSLGKGFSWIRAHFYAYFFFSYALVQYDIFHYYLDGGILRRTPISGLELLLLKAMGKKIIGIPYGSDAFIYEEISNPLWRHALLINYPMHSKSSKKIRNKIRQFNQYADVIVGCLVHYVNLPRWDILPLTCYPVNTQSLIPVYSTGNDSLIIAHAPNHRGIKGTEFIINAVNQLKNEGFNIELDIIEKVSNEEAIKRISMADIFVDQLIFGYALAALEAMALGKVVISGIEDTKDYVLFKRYSYLKECPIIPSNPEEIYETLKWLIINKDEIPLIGKRSRKFVEERHSFEACSTMFETIYQKIYEGKHDIDLINFYHPLFEKKTRNI